MTTIALTIGIVLALLVGPGQGMNVDPSTLDAQTLTAHSDNAISSGAAVSADSF